MSPPRGAAELYIGLMSGTSLDGIDAVLADFGTPVPTTVAHVHKPLATALRAELLALNAAGADEIHRTQVAAAALAQAYADAVHTLLKVARIDPDAVRAIGAHGQTVRHRPDLGYTVQINAPALLAELTGIDVVADFRSRDVAACGQGAPLVPAFHRLVFGGVRPRAVVNIGGISNVTALDADPVIGFDAGPGNALIDGWMAAHFNAPFDADGTLAGTARADERLVDAWMQDPFFAASPPKSTGRDLFTLAWALRSPRVKELEPVVVLASLTDLTARSIAEAILRWVPGAQEVLVCGGGARNATLLRSLERKLGGSRTVKATDALGVPCDQVEALAFAWLARRHIRREAGNVPSVTGARGERILGALYPGGPSGIG